MEPPPTTKQYDSVKQFVLKGLNESDLDFKRAAETFNSNDEIVKTAIEQSFRIYVLQNLPNMQITDMRHVLDLSVQTAQKKLCLPTTPIYLINDMLSVLSIEKCSEIFCYLEDSSHVWKSDTFYTSVKNYLLRMCNDLLKRLSKSQNTVFSGRIHLFLAKLFPLNEKSGLNLMSHFSDNVTRYTTSAEAFEEAINKANGKSIDNDVEMEKQPAKDDKHLMPIDYNLYAKFWSLQELFSKPNLSYDKVAWKQFTSNSNEVFDALKSFRLEDAKEREKEKQPPQSTKDSTTDEEETDLDSYFSKYLTSEKLLNLQLNDSNFRRQILIQFLIMFQYLNADTKFKTQQQQVSDEQFQWVRSASKRVNELLRETPPCGSKFVTNVRKILEREEIWNKWKNEGCPNYVKEKKPWQPTAVQQARAKRVKTTTADFIQSTESNMAAKVSKSTSEIAKLCNINHGNLDACRDASREFLPTLREFFEDCIEQLDPVNQVDKEYRLIYQTDWSWKALRLLAKRSAYYFMFNQNVKTIPEYLEAICGRLNREFVAADAAKNKAAAAVVAAAKKEKEDEKVKEEKLDGKTTTSTKTSKTEKNEMVEDVEDCDSPRPNSDIMQNEQQENEEEEEEDEAVEDDEGEVEDVNSSMGGGSNENSMMDDDGSSTPVRAVTPSPLVAVAENATTNTATSGGEEKDTSMDEKIEADNTQTPKAEPETPTTTAEPSVPKAEPIVSKEEEVVPKTE